MPLNRTETSHGEPDPQNIGTKRMYNNHNQGWMNAQSSNQHENGRESRIFTVSRRQSIQNSVDVANDTSRLGTSFLQNFVFVFGEFPQIRH